MKSNCHRKERKTATARFNLPSQCVTALRQELLHKNATSSSLLWFIIPYLIPLITSTLQLTISQNTSDKNDFCCRLGVMLMSYAGCLLRNADSRPLCHQWNPNREVDFGTVSKHQINLCRAWALFLPTYSTEGECSNRLLTELIPYSLPQTKQSGCAVPRRGQAAGELHRLTSVNSNSQPEDK